MAANVVYTTPSIVMLVAFVGKAVILIFVIKPALGSVPLKNEEGNV